MAESEKMKKSEEKTASPASKKQKTEADGLAVPGTANTIRCAPYF